jgi:hypothetical protein
VLSGTNSCRPFEPEVFAKDRSLRSCKSARSHGPLQVRQIRRPDQRGQIIDHTIVDLSCVASRGNFGRFYPCWPMRWTLLFVKEEPVHAVGITFEGYRPIFQIRQQHRGDANVIIDDLPFRESDVGIKNLFEVGHSQLLSSDFDFDFFTRGAACLFLSFRGAPSGA